MLTAIFVNTRGASVSIQEDLKTERGYIARHERRPYVERNEIAYIEFWKDINSINTKRPYKVYKVIEDIQPIKDLVIEAMITMDGSLNLSLQRLLSKEFTITMLQVFKKIGDKYDRKILKKAVDSLLKEEKLIHTNPSFEFFSLNRTMLLLKDRVYLTLVDITLGREILDRVQVREEGIGMWVICNHPSLVNEDDGDIFKIVEILESEGKLTINPKKDVNTLDYKYPPKIFLNKNIEDEIDYPNS